MSTLQIGLVLPDVLGTYGDDGNALVLRQRARMRGFDANIVRIHLGDPIPTSLDVYCLGGGEDTAQILAAEHINTDGGLHKAAAAGHQHRRWPAQSSGGRPTHPGDLRRVAGSW